MSEKEKRENPRFGLKLPVRITWKDDRGNERETSGMTVDISSSGALVVCNSLIEKGSEVGVVIKLPNEVAGTGVNHLSVRGKVVREDLFCVPSVCFGHGIVFDSFRVETLKYEDVPRRLWQTAHVGMSAQK
jgi:hypothetical protein